MLYYDFAAVFKARNINNIYGFLVKNGFTKRAAANLAYGKDYRLSLGQLYTICRLVNCTPNDVIRYQPGEREMLHPDHSLHTITGPALSGNVIEALKGLSLKELDEINNIIKKRKEMIL